MILERENVKEKGHISIYEIWYLNERLQEKLADELYIVSFK